jgi:hypothetical protein
MQDAEPREGASNVSRWRGFTPSSRRFHGVYSIHREGGSFKPRLGTRSFGNSVYFFFMRDEIQLLCLKKGMGKEGTIE